MVKKLLVGLTIVFTFSFFISPAFAQTPQYNTGYFEILRQLIIKQTILMSQVEGIQSPVTPQATPTIYNQPTPTPTKAAVQATVTPTKVPTKTPTTTPTKAVATLTPTKTAAIATPTPTRRPTATPSTAPASDTISFIMNEINAYRASQGLSSVSTSQQTCSFAAIRAKEISTSFNHDGFQSRMDSKSLPYTSWTKVTENIAMTSNYKDVVTMWKNSAGHAANMRADTPFVCVQQYGNYYAYEGMKP